MIGFYQGTTLMSRMIRWRTWSDYSHVSWITEGGSVLEAWRNGVNEWPTVHHNHKPGTKVTLLGLDYSHERIERIESFLRDQLGKRYDRWGVFGFLARSDRLQNPNDWFCSELIFAAHLYAGIALLARVPAHKVFPGLIYISPILRERGGIVTEPPG